MNTSYQGTKEAPHLLAWLKTHPYPHCRSANSLSSLRSGTYSSMKEWPSQRY
jgi:hypothetical protein